MSKYQIPIEIYDSNFKELFRTSVHPREKIRYLAFCHLQDGKSPREVAEIVRVTRNTIYRWLRNFQTHGANALLEQPGRGKKPLIPKSERAAFRKSVEELQAARSGGSITGKDVLQLMKEKYGIECSLKSVYNHLKKASLVWISARSKHPNVDFHQQEEFKKNFEEK